LAIVLADALDLVEEVTHHSLVVVLPGLRAVVEGSKFIDHHVSSLGCQLTVLDEGKVQLWRQQRRRYLIEQLRKAHQGR
jgi:hypothetical protein